MSKTNLKNKKQFVKLEIDEQNKMILTCENLDLEKFFSRAAEINELIRKQNEFKLFRP